MGVVCFSFTLTINNNIVICFALFPPPFFCVSKLSFKTKQILSFLPKLLITQKHFRFPKLLHFSGIPHEKQYFCNNSTHLKRILHEALPNAHDTPYLVDFLVSPTFLLLPMFSLLSSIFSFFFEQSIDRLGDVPSDNRPFHFNSSNVSLLALAFSIFPFIFHLAYTTRQHQIFLGAFPAFSRFVIEFILDFGLHLIHNGRVCLKFPYLRVYCYQPPSRIVPTKRGSWLVVYAVKFKFCRVHLISIHSNQHYIGTSLHERAITQG